MTLTQAHIDYVLNHARWALQRLGVIARQSGNWITWEPRPPSDDDVWPSVDEALEMWRRYDDAHGRFYWHARTVHPTTWRRTFTVHATGG